MLDRFLIIDIIKNALLEDMNSGDFNSNLISKDIVGTGIITAKESGIVSGLCVAKETFNLIDEDIKFTSLKEDGDNVNTGEDIAVIEGRLQSILKGERVALNFLQRMSGIATKAKLYSEKVSKYSVKIVDTRKTTPGLRILEKYSVRVGGCFNHRYNLSDGIMIKDNHIKALGGIKNAVKKAKELAPHTTKIEVEVTNLKEVNEALEAKADIIMLDNMNLEEMKDSVKVIDGRAIVESSGNVNINRVEDIAKTGVDIISVGELTHSVKSLDLSLNIKME